MPIMASGCSTCKLASNNLHSMFVRSPNAGEAKVFIKPAQLVDNRPIMMPNDLDFISRDEILLTDSSTRWQRRDVMTYFAELSADGR